MKYILNVFCVIPMMAFAQFTDTIQLPIIETPQYTVYISASGSDSDSGDSLHPAASFAGALNMLDNLTAGQTGDVFTEVVLFPGAYYFALAQPLGKYQIGAKRLNVSVRGRGEVILDGNGLTLSGGQGMVSLLGSHISVKNLKIVYSPSNGVRFGYDYSGTVVNPHDIVIENVEVAQTAGHGIIVGIGPLNTANPFVFTPLSERFLIRNCYVHHAVNFNQPQSQWGSAIKFHNIRHGKAVNCLVHDNSGEGIDVDFGQYIEISDNRVFDNYANIYLDKAENVIIRNNLIYNTHRRETGILLGIEPFSALLTDHYVKDVCIFNNVILNTPAGIAIWQGTYSGLQNGYFSGIKILHNTIIGKTTGNGGPISFSYVTAFGQPAPNVLFSGLEIKNNIVSAHTDSLNNGRLVNGPLNPQPGLETGFNLWSKNPVIAYDIATDRIDASLPYFADPLGIEKLIPHPDSNDVFIMNAPRLLFVDDDYFHGSRFPDSTNAGAFESDTAVVSDTLTTGIYFNYHETIFAYPNPFSENVTIKIKNQNNQKIFYELFDVNGKKMNANITLTQDHLILSREGIPSGIYFFRIMTDDKIFAIKLAVD